jgi:hypothetical protein
MSPVGFEPMISADERPQTHALERAATGTGRQSVKLHNIPEEKTPHIKTLLVQNVEFLEVKLTSR